ncbi:MAG: aminotransferase class I/II-fold pyridoxal phosphate-dependent enzyme [Saprospiraceae bacterium]|nr:aminotransferase class I/II-fold pyridoxal phosphate-dependent enzyme [Saprospiraceae bacterium]
MKNKKVGTILCHDEERFLHGPVVPPIYQNSLFTFENWDAIDKAFDAKAESYIYSRLLNPTVEVAEKKIAELCKGEKAKLCASGIAAVTSAILHCVSAGDHIVAVENIYGPTNNFIGTYLKSKFNISVTYVDGTNTTQFEEALRDNTKLIYLESPASLTFELQDLKAVTALAKRNGIKTIIDNTWATPIFQNPLSLGVDIEVHSVSKYLCGHSDVVAGVIISTKNIIDAIIQAEHELFGAKMAPFEGWLILRSLRTLELRMERHMQNAMAIAKHLDKHPNVDRVFYPGLSSFQQYELGQNQMRGYSGLLSFKLATSDISKIKAFVNALQIFKIGVSWGGHDSLVYAPVISYLKELSPDRFEAMGIDASIIRISVGLEGVEDLIRDLDQALDY